VTAAITLQQLRRGFRRDVLDPRFDDRSVSAIAFACGFGDLSGFNRAFKDAYVTPSEMRSAALGREAR
jgi:AraC-like DNA-binding protein